MATTQFQAYLDEHHLPIDIIESEAPTRTAAEAAAVHDVPVSAIVKSILLKADDQFVLFLVPGDRQLDLDLQKEKLGARELRMATPDEVKRVTGYSIGGVPPFGHLQPIKTLITEGFDPKGMVVPAAGAGNAVFKTPYTKLAEIVSRTV